jgi:hypothetical protein
VNGVVLANVIFPLKWDLIFSCSSSCPGEAAFKNIKRFHFSTIQDLRMERESEDVLKSV